MLVVQDNVLSFVHIDVQGREPLDGRAENVQVPPAMVVGLLGEEGAVEISQIVVNGSSPAISSGQVDAVVAQEGHVGLGPGILVPTNHNTRVVSPQEKQMLKSIL